MERPVTGRCLIVVALLLLGAVETWRAADLARRGRESASAHNEQRWRPWAYRRADLPQLLGVAADRLRRGDDVALLVPQGLTHDWWRVMALYYLPGQRVVGVYDLSGRRAAPPGASRVLIDRRNRVHVAGPAQRTSR